MIGNEWSEINGVSFSSGLELNNLLANISSVRSNPSIKKYENEFETFYYCTPGYQSYCCMDCWRFRRSYWSYKQSIIRNLSKRAQCAAPRSWVRCAPWFLPEFVSVFVPATWWIFSSSTFLPSSMPADLQVHWLTYLSLENKHKAH